MTKVQASGTKASDTGLPFFLGKTPDDMSDEDLLAALLAP